MTGKCVYHFISLFLKSVYPLPEANTHHIRRLFLSLSPISVYTVPLQSAVTISVYNHLTLDISTPHMSKTYCFRQVDKRK